MAAGEHPHAELATPEFVLTLDCPDRPGIVHAVASYLVHSAANILESQQFDDRVEDRFFMRVHFELTDPAVTLDQLRDRLRRRRRDLGHDAGSCSRPTSPFRTLVLVSQFGHCLNDLLFRWSTGALQHRDPRDRVQPP